MQKRERVGGGVESSWVPMIGMVAWVWHGGRRSRGRVATGTGCGQRGERGCRPADPALLATPSHTPPCGGWIRGGSYICFGRGVWEGTRPAGPRAARQWKGDGRAIGGRPRAARLCCRSSRPSPIARRRGSWGGHAPRTGRRAGRYNSPPPLARLQMHAMPAADADGQRRCPLHLPHHHASPFPPPGPIAPPPHSPRLPARPGA